MALPPAIQTVTVNFGPMIDYQGLALKGSTTFEPSVPLLHAATGTVILNKPITVEWDLNGTGTVILPATDSTGLNVTGFTYRVTHRVFDSGVPAPLGANILLPAAAPVVDLDLLLPTSASNGIVVAQPAVTSVAGFTGVVTTDQLNSVVSGGGGGTVTPDATSSVKGKIQLAGDLGGTAAAPTVPGLANKVNTSTYTAGLAAKADTASLAAVAQTGSYTDLANKPTIPAAYTDEQVMDLIGSTIVAGTGITKTVDDAGNTVTITATGTAATDASTTVKGVVELATTVETSTGTDTTRAVTAAGVAAATRRGGTGMRSAPEILDDFTVKPDGAIGSALTGQAWTQTGNFATTVVSGRLTDAYGAAGAGYSLTPAAGEITYMAAEFAFTAGTNGGSFAIIAFASDLSGGNNASPCHISLTPVGWSVATLDAAGAFTSIGVGTYLTPLVKDGVTAYSVEVVIDRAAAAVFLRLPDGNTVSLPHATVATRSGTWFCIENFYAATGDAKPRILRAMAHSYPIGRDSQAWQVRQSVLMAALTATKTDAEGVRDTIGAALVAGSGVTITPNDGADTITIAATGGGGGAVSSVNGQTGAVVLNAANVGAIAAADAVELQTTTAGTLTQNGTTTNLAADAGHTHRLPNASGGLIRLYTADATAVDLSVSGGVVGATDPEVVRDTIASALVAGTNVTITPDDAANTITISAAGGGGGVTDPEVVRDTIASALVAGTGITVTPNDGADTITIAATGGGGGSSTRVFGGQSPYLMPPGAIAVTGDRLGANWLSNTVTSGTRYMTAIALQAGDVISAVNARSNGYSGGTNSWAGLCNSAGQVLAVSASDTTASFAGPANRSWTLTSPYTVPTSGLYYVMWMLAGTTPSLISFIFSMPIVGMPPIVNGTANTGETAPPAVGSTSAAIVAAQTVPYMWLT